MKQKFNKFSRVLSALLLCAGLVAVGCTEGPLGDDQNTEQGAPELEGPVTITLEKITCDSVTFNGHLNVSASDLPFSKVSIYYSDTESFDINTAQVVSTTSFDKDQNFSITLTRLKGGTKYNYCMVAEIKSEKVYGDVVSLTIPFSPSNCHIVSEVGFYIFKAVKGNSSESVGNVASASVLWESFGTDIAPNVGDLLKEVSYKDGYIEFKTADTFKEGNAVIAAMDAEGTILWSWHIWFTDQPWGQEYFNNAGTIMDRNLGATSATPGDVGALGLLYQWGRKDPFLGSSSISTSIGAASTIAWPSAVSSDSSNGTIEYATANPTTFITCNSSNSDWYYTGSSSTDNTRWTTLETSKSIYDPCPSGWRVPDGGGNGVWSKALGSSLYFTQSSLYESANKGMNFSGKFGSASTIWYPVSGSRDYNDGSLLNVGRYGYYWSASPNDYDVCYLRFTYGGYVYPSGSSLRANGLSVRCLQESK